MQSNNRDIDELREGNVIDLQFSHDNKTIKTKGYVKGVSNDSVTIGLNIDDKNMTPPAGADICVLEKDILYKVTDSNNFPEIKAARAARRNHIRVDDTLKIAYRNIPQEFYDKNAKRLHVIFKETFGEVYKLPEVEDLDLKTIYKLIYQVNLKVNHILDILKSEGAKTPSSAQYEQVNISASGMRFTANCNFQIGDVLAFRIFLPLAITPINILGKVARTAEAEGKYMVAVKFIDLTDNDHEMITKYIFKRQRELLREGRH